MGFFLIVVIIVVVIITSGKYNKAVREKWQKAARALRLNYQPGGSGSFGTISGISHGHRVSVSTFTRGTGKSSSSYTKYAFHYSCQTAVDFKIEHQGLMQSVGKVFGMQDIEVGDPSFDDCALVHGRNPDAVIQFLTPRRQQKIRKVLQAYTDVSISGTGIELVKSGKDTEDSIIVHTVRNLLVLCDAMVSIERPLPSAEKREPQPPVKPAVVPVEEEPPSLPPEEPETPVQETEPEILDVESPPLEVPEPEPLPEPEPAMVAPADLRQVAESLFGKRSGGSLQTAKIFTEEFKDRAVTGSGVLKRVDKFSYDPVFTNCKGVKATYEICEIKDAYSKFNVSAVLKYPADSYDMLKGRVGDTMSVSGQLFAQDTMMHQLYLVEDNP